MDVDSDHGAGYGNTLAWRPGSQPGMGEIEVEVQDDLDTGRFYNEFAELMRKGK